MKKCRAFLAIVLMLILVLSIPASAQGTGKSYVYNHNRIAQEIPDPYNVTKIAGQGLGMVKPVDMTIHNDEVYVLDTDHDAADGYSARILILNQDYQLDREIFFKEGGEAYDFQEAKGLWVDELDRIYVADRSAHKLDVFDPQGNLTHSFGLPESPMITYTEESYLPTKVLTDHLGVIYVQVEGDYRGFIMMDQNGEFLGYFGSNDVTRTADVIAMQFWKIIMTDEQLQRVQLVLPMEYSNFCIDEAGAFIYGVRGSTEDMNELIRKINCKSKNVLDYKSTFGDYNLARVGGQAKKTSFNAITVDEDGFITAFDSTWQRLFQYTPEGDLMYVFGGQGSQQGTFINGVDVESWGKQLLVLDSDYATVTVMEPSTFGSNVRQGEIYYSQGDYQSSMAPFQAVVAECMNYEFGYQGIGKAQYMQRDYEAAMDSFYLAHDQLDYSMAFKMYRGEVMRSLTLPFLILIVLIAVIAITVSILRKKGILKKKKLVLDESGKVKYMFHTLLHPIEGYEEMRYNKKYSLAIANIAIFFFFFSSVIMSMYSGFIFNGKNAQNYNVLITIVSVLGGFTLFVLVNWLMATFLEGKGKFKEVWIYLGYATIPYSVTCFLYTLLSNLLTSEESTFLWYLMIIGQGWAIVMVFFALQGLHMYSFWRNILSILITILGMLAVIFIIFLMFNLFVQFFSFVESIYTESMYRFAVGF
ncbi:MAG: YIP1 family protein [Clostridia bacterium]|nr:YIP1 family protein [Clostridia bacterium]